MQPGEFQSAQHLPSTPSLEARSQESQLKGRLQWPFWGPNGLRALWRLLIFLAIVLGLRFAIIRLFHLRGRISELTPRNVLGQEAMSFLIVVAASAIMGAFEKRSFADYGLPLRGAFGSRFFEGLLWGFLAEGGTIVILYFTGNASFQGLEQRGPSVLYFGVMWAAAFLLVGFFEEFLFRGYPQFTLATGIGFWPAAIVLSGMFWWGHMGNPGETWVGGLSVALYAIAMCVALRLTGNLWFAIGMHAAGDWAETYFFGVPDSGMTAHGHLLNTALSGNKWMSGGTVGPEGSVVELLIVTAVIGLLFVRFRQKPEQRLTAPLS